MSEVERLRDWKESALYVLEQWDGVYAALGSPGGLGMSKPAAARAEVERLREEDADRRAQMAHHAFTAPDAGWDVMFGSLAGRIADLVDSRVDALTENERLRTEIARLRSELTDHIFKIEHLERAVQAVRDLIAASVVSGHSEYIAVADLRAALGGERDE